ncbi:hypothetical protein [Planctomonas psychrotolerans]|uniref:hypothetical protein n=1 Tax=Planctomonas psychrotolerans TaxID=2528712 RepID=UPI00123B391C|nr:hypothetical protein [Planctomonas psychrotolerans]
MRVLLKLILDCDPDAAWRAIQSPAVLREVSSPLLDFEPIAPDAFPTMWGTGAHPVRALAARSVPMGEQVIDISFPATRVPDVRMMRDSGKGLSGLLALTTRWDHRMAISPDPAGTGKTLYRDQLIFEAGPVGAALWPPFWAFWQWRGAQLKRMAPTWASDVGEPKPGSEERDTSLDDAGFSD